MKYFLVLISISFSTSFVLKNEKKSYEGYKVIKTARIENSENIKGLLVLDDVYKDINFWTFPLLNQSAEIMTSPQSYKTVTSILNKMKIDHEIKIENVEKLIKEENPEFENSRDDEMMSQNRMNWYSYQRYNVIKNYCESMSRSKAGLVSTEIIGRSSEGRDIVMVKVSKSGQNRNKPAIFIDGGMHAREWISPAVSTYILNRLVNDNRNADLLENFDWYFVPVVNVDGYEYSHTRERLWRKTRSRSNNGCYGVDPNRNFGYHWSESGSSTNPCSDIYHGPRAFSEPETRALGNAILNIHRRTPIKLYLTFHSYSQLWLIPYGFGYQKPSDYNELYRLGNVGKTALENTYGTRYRIGTATDLLYSAAGGSDDWAKGGANIKYSYTLELRDKGSYGFILPANQIKATGEETFAGVAALVRNLSRK